MEALRVQLVKIGNTGLVAEHANDYDMLYERYLPSVGMIEGGYFYKQITKPIYLQQSIVPATGSPLSQSYAGDHVLQEVNGDHAYVQGIELAYQQHLSSLPGVLGGARIIANFAYTNSKNYNLDQRTDTPGSVGQAPYSWNIGPAYATKRALVTLGISHNGANIYAYQYQSTGPGAVPFGVTGPNGDNYFYSHADFGPDAQRYCAHLGKSPGKGECLHSRLQQKWRWFPLRLEGLRAGPHQGNRSGICKVMLLERWLY